MSDYCTDCGSTDATDLGHDKLTACCGAPVSSAHFANRRQRKALRVEDDQ